MKWFIIAIVQHPVVSKKSVWLSKSYGLITEIVSFNHQHHNDSYTLYKDLLCYEWETSGFAMAKDSSVFILCRKSNYYIFTRLKTMFGDINFIMKMDDFSLF